MTGSFATRCVAIAVASCLVTGLAWGHTFPPMRTVVVQVDPCELSVMIGYRPGTGEPTEAILARISNSPKARILDTLREVMSAYAVAPLTVSADGKPLVPTKVRAKVGVEEGGARPIVVVLVTYPLATETTVTVASRDPRSTRISWQDLESGRIDLQSAPAQHRWFSGVASFLLSLHARTGDSVCARSKPARSSALSH